MDIWANKKAAPATDKPGTMAGWAKKENPGSKGASDSSPAPVTQRKSVGSTGVSRDDYWANKEARDLEKEKTYRTVDLPAIRRSTSYNVAATLAAAALANDALSFGSAAKGKRIDMFLGYLDQIAEHVYARINGDEIVSESQDAEQEVNDAEDNLG